MRKNLKYINNILNSFIRDEDDQPSYYYFKPEFEITFDGDDATYETELQYAIAEAKSDKNRKEFESISQVSIYRVYKYVWLEDANKYVQVGDYAYGDVKDDPMMIKLIDDLKDQLGDDAEDDDDSPFILFTYVLDPIEEGAAELLDEVKYYINDNIITEYNGYEIEPPDYGKYSTIWCKQIQGDDSFSIGLRIADHRHNPLRESGDHFISVVIANEDPTFTRFGEGVHELRFDKNNTPDDVYGEINDKIKEIIDDR